MTADPARQFAFLLAREQGWLEPDRMLGQMTARTLREWETWYSVSPFAQLGTNPLAGAIGGTSTPAAPPQTIEQQKAQFNLAKMSFEKRRKKSGE